MNRRLFEQFKALGDEERARRSEDVRWRARVEGGLPAEEEADFQARALLDDEVAHMLRLTAPSAEPELDALVGRAFELCARPPTPSQAPPRLARVLPFVLLPLAAAAGLALVPEVVGRDRELARLVIDRGAIERGAFAATVLGGPTGAGKSSVAARFAVEAEHSGFTVLRSRALPTERVAFNGVADAIESLAASLVSGPGAASISDPARVAASAAFQVLAEVGTVASLGVTRGAAFGGVIDLMTKLARRGRGLVLLVDDLQWADTDAVALLAHLVDRAPPGVFLVGTLRTDVGPSPASTWLDGARRVERVEVTPLGDDAVGELVRRALATRAAEATDADVRAIVRLSAGRPLLAEVASRSMARAARDGKGGASSKAEVPADPFVAMRTRITALGPVPKRALAALVALEGWARTGDLGRIVDAAPVALEHALRELEDEGLVRRARAPGDLDVASVFHDAIRVAALDALAEETVRTAHGAIAELLERDPAAPAAALVRHLLGAGRTNAAAERAVAGAAHAEGIRAFGLAADLYAVAIEHNPDAGALRRRQAENLDRAGRYVEAAAAWGVIAAALTGELATDARLDQACSLLAANDVVAGRDRLDRTLASMGEPTTGAGFGGYVAALAFLLGPPRSRTTGRPPADAETETETETEEDARRRAERDVRLGMLVMYFDPLSGLRFLRRAQTQFARAGTVEGVAWCDLVFAYYAYFGHGRRGPFALADRYRRAAETQLQGRTVVSPIVATMPRFIEGVASLREGRWRDASAEIGAVVETLEGAGLSGTFEHMMALVHRTQASVFAQDVGEARRWVTHFREVARASSDSALRCHADFLHVLVGTYEGRFEEAAADSAVLRSRWPDAPTLQRVLLDVYTAAPDVYLTDGRETRARIALTLARGARYRMLESMYGGQLAALAALTEATALRSGDPAASPRRIRKWAAIARRSPPYATMGAVRAEAYAADAVGAAPERAIALLEEAERSSTRYGQRVDAAIARYQRGLRLGGAEGAHLVEDARASIVVTGASPRLLEEDAGRR